jgi:hypothetical protein
MTPTFARLLADAWGVFRREADLIMRLAGPFVFLPAFAVQLLCDPLPAIPAQPRDESAMAAWITLVSAWGEDNAIWYVLADLVGMIGLAAIALLLLAPDKPSVGEALHGALRRLGRFVLLDLLVAIPVGLGLWIFVLPGLYVQARLIAALAVLAAEPQHSATRAIARSWQATSRATWAILGAVVALFLLQWLAVSPLFPLDAWLREPGHDNPFVVALVAMLLAIAGTVYSVAMLLVGVVSYRRFARSGT